MLVDERELKSASENLLLEAVSVLGIEYMNKNKDPRRTDRIL